MAVVTSSARSLPVVQGEPLPPLYAKWVEAVLPGPIPREVRATCDACPMCAGVSDQLLSSPIAFDPGTKCCTYLPALANFLVGSILSDEELVGSVTRASVESRIRDLHAVTPLRVGMTASYEAAYDAAKGDQFGRAHALRCPHYVETANGRCGIWRHRNGVCATWFCKHIRGGVGKVFWDNLRGLLHRVEEELALWCVLELRLDALALRRLMDEGARSQDERRDQERRHEIDPAAAKTAYRQRWGSWAGREHLFYRSCFVLVSQLEWSDVCQIAGQRVRAWSDMVMRSYAQLVHMGLPDRLKVAKISASPINDASVRVWTYSPYDTLVLSTEVFRVLHYFDGCPTRQALDEIRARQNVTLDDQLVGRLADFGVLEAVTDDPP